ncbi:unnamed protein product [Didymodactylos carnosus]|uniref:N-acetyltransferase domain-containing protein n=1 Tax=Didymodactylos carnosus TaxID=1234261 RepID=A0A8S2JGM7_9BILA|nr:unnamed protein product [Didymodactylos carnosus]CAF3810235.1 unnamed protein product [Didymodactylos carnosus]
MHIPFFLIDESMRGQHIGKWLLAEIEQYAWAQSVDHIQLNPVDEEAESFFKHMNYALYEKDFDNALTKENPLTKEKKYSTLSVISIVNLISMGLFNGQRRFKDARIISLSEQFKYSYNPCYSFTEAAYQNVAACQNKRNAGKKSK